MDIHFDLALQLIDLGDYKGAVENLETAIRTDTDNGDMKSVTECRCVFGELLMNLGENERALEEFDKVLSYCNLTNTLFKQREIALDFIKKIKLEEAERQEANTSDGAENSSVNSKFLQ